AGGANPIPPMSQQPLPPRRSASEQERLHHTIREIFEERVSFNRLLGIRITSFEPLDPRVCFDMRPDLVGEFNSPRLHGGVTASVLDATAGLGIMLGLGEKFSHETADQIALRIRKVGTIDLRIDYLRVGQAARYEARAFITRLGGRIASARMELHGNDGLMVATGAASFVTS
ncbi:MAG: hypothetical protein RL434_2912, partial [Pseudomonadota bacterium]